jgi:hypothetical protein
MAKIKKPTAWQGKGRPSKDQRKFIDKIRAAPVSRKVKQAND